MTARPAAGPDDRVLLLAPTRKDAFTTAEMLQESGILMSSCQAFDALLAELDVGAAVLIVPEEAMSPAHTARLAARLQDQPPWSDVPVLVLAYAGAASTATKDAVRLLGNVTVLERPVRVPTLLSAVRTALRARQRQYQIREHLTERARAEESLRRADQRKDEFRATLGHELRKPLAPLLSGMQLLRLRGVEDAGLAPIMAAMERQITHLVRLVDDLLEVSRITRGLIEVRHDPVDLVAAVRGAIDTCQPVLDGAGHHLIADMPDAPVPVAGDQVRLTQVFANLLTNAAKYTNTGGRIHVGVSHSAGSARVSVRDNGIGIQPSQLSSVFEMFMQVDRSNRRAQGGLGIGLTLVRTLVEMHGGRVEARSDGLGKGTEFVVVLPVLVATLKEHARPAPLGRFPNRRLLIVDDKHDAARTLSDLLRTLGATVAVAHSGRSALERLADFDPDAILLDIGMPEMDGYEVARRIRALPDRANTLLIALTGWGQDHDYSQSRAAGFDHHMVKPPNIEKLRELLARHQRSASPRVDVANGSRRDEVDVQVGERHPDEAAPRK